VETLLVASNPLTLMAVPLKTPNPIDAA